MTNKELADRLCGILNDSEPKGSIDAKVIGQAQADGCFYKFRHNGPPPRHEFECSPARMLANDEVPVKIPPVREWPEWADCVRSEPYFAGNGKTTAIHQKITLITRAEAEAREATK